jgi:hypothetical protein
MREKEEKMKSMRMEIEEYQEKERELQRVLQLTKELDFRVQSLNI